MIEIPKVLIRRLSAVGTKRFIRVSPRDKNPIDQAWQKMENRRLPDDIILKAWLEGGGNYGIVGGQGLIIIDADTNELDKILEEKLPPTFKVLSPGSQLPHRYYQSDVEKPLRLRSKDGENIGDIQGRGKQVLGPESIHPNGKKYSIIDKCPLAYLSKKTIEEVLEKWLVPEKELEEIEKIARQETTNYPNLSISDVLSVYKIQLSLKQGVELYGSHPVHGSSTGRNFWINLEQNVWCCFRCGTGGGSLSLIAVLEGFIKCEEATKGALRNEKFVKTLKKAVEKGLINKKQLILNPKGLKETLFSEERYNAKTLADNILARHKFITTGIRTDIYRYRPESGIWTPDGEQVISEIATQLLGDKFSENRVRQALVYIRNNVFVESSIFEKNKKKIVLQNGVLNLKNLQLEPFDPDICAISALPVKYDSNAYCPNIISFMKEIVPDDIQTLQEWIGYHLLKAYPYHKALMLLGDGANGKSTFFNLLTIFLGGDNITNLSLHEITSSRFSTADLYGKLGNIAYDISPDELKRTGKLKALVGGDRVRAEKKYQDPFYFRNHAKLGFSANQLPPTPDLTSAFFRRWLLINFPNKFEGTNCDPKILSKITIPEELSGMLNWAVEGLRRLDKKGEFTRSQTSEEIQYLYEEMSDPVTAFISQHIEQDTSGIISKDDLYNIFFAFCRKRGFPSIPKNTFTKELKPRIPTLKDSRRKIGDRRVMCWVGIKLKDVRGVKDDRGIISSYNKEEKEEENKENNNNPDTLDTPDFTSTLVEKMEEILQVLVDHDKLSERGLQQQIDIEPEELGKILEILIRDGRIFQPVLGYWKVT